VNNNDQRIAAALDADDQAFLASLDSDRGMFQQIGDTWKGPLGGWAKLGFVVAIAIGLGLVYCVYRAMTADGTDAILGWGLSSLALLIMQGFLKQWMFEQVNMLTVLREVKRLQVQIAMLSEKDC